MQHVAQHVAIQFHFRDSNDKYLRRMERDSQQLLSSIEGDVAIHLDGCVIFRDQHFNVLEFGIDLLGWLSSARSGAIESHEYNSVDFDEGPLIRFTHIQGSVWEIQSPWMEDGKAHLCDGQALFAACLEYLSRLRSQLRAKYGIMLDAYRI